MTAWDTDLGRWRQQWWDYLRGGANSPEIPDGSVETADEAFAREIALARSAVDPVPAEPPTVWVDDVRDYGSDWDRVVGVVMRDREPNPAMVVIQTKPRDPVEDEVCDDERDADAAVGVMPAPLVVYAEPAADA